MTLASRFTWKQLARTYLAAFVDSQLGALVEGWLVGGSKCLAIKPWSRSARTIIDSNDSGATYGLLCRDQKLIFWRDRTFKSVSLIRPAHP